MSYWLIIIGNISIYLKILYVFISFFALIAICLMIIIKNKFKINKQYENIDTNVNNILSFFKKVIILFLVMTIILIFLPTRNQILTIISTQSIVKNFENSYILTNKNLLKIEKMINIKINDLKVKK